VGIKKPVNQKKIRHISYKQIQTTVVKKGGFQKPSAEGWAMVSQTTTFGSMWLSLHSAKKPNM
jgi:hypothetical protein